MSFRALFPALLVVAALGLTACDSKEERAEKHYQRGVALLAEGEPDRAAIEFRNVFRLNGQHKDARLAYARLLRDRGDVVRALNQYGFLVDIDRASLDGHKERAALALSAQDFAVAAESAGRAFELAPADPQARALKATVDYRDGADRPAAVAMAEGVIAEEPGNVIAHMVVIADRLNRNDAAGALRQADVALAEAPQDEGLHLVRLAALEALGDDASVGAALDRMAELFPDNPGVLQARVQWRLRQGDVAGAEGVLRARAEAEPVAAEPALTVVQFLYETSGPAAARAELDRLAAAAPDPLPFRRARAGLDFAEGDHDAAITAMRALLAEATPEGAEPTDATRDLQAELAQMLGADGDAAGRDALVAEILVADPRQVAALKLRAQAAIDADKPDLAIQDMRAALKEAPRDPEVMTIMAMAHEREGARELAGERLALAVEASGQAPAESLRYARFLMREGKPGPAESVTTSALRRAPENRDLLALLGEIHVARGDWPRVGQVAEILRGQGDPAATAIAGRLEAARLAAGGDTEATLTALRAMAADGGDAAALVQLMQAYVAAGDLAGARAYLDDLLAADPASRPARLMLAGLEIADGQPDAAEALYRTLIAEEAAAPQPHRALVALLARQGRAEEADAALAAGIAATGAASPGGDRELVFLRAGFREGAGDFEGAIADYETIYARDSGDMLVANNLASLLSTRRDDPESLERAFAIARRLRGSEVPYFQDTYGWILHRRGDSPAALRALGPAAEALPDNALVQYHAGETLFALGQHDAAKARFEAAVAAAEGTPEAGLPQIAAAKARIAEIDAAPSAPAGQAATQATDG
jgi:predicted Zn-dependent protease